MLSLINKMMLLLRSEILNIDLDTSLLANINDEDLSNLYSISKCHDISHLVGDALLKNNLLPECEIKEKFEKQVMLSIFRYQKSQYELDKIKKIFLQENIPFIPLKGSVIRNWYPQPWMRTSCDIDILIHEEDLLQAVKCLHRYEYTQSGQTSHDIAFISKSNVHLELHHNLIEKGRIGKASQVLQSIWNYAKPSGNTSEYLLDDNMYYYYHIAHMAKHFEIYGGCGIRPFLDLWILNNRGGDIKERELLLSLGGLDKFSSIVNELSDYWMGGKEPSSLAIQLGEIILSGGTYGNESNSIVMRRGKSKSELHYILNRIWTPYNLLIGEFPSLKGKRILQPAYEIRRWFKLLKKDSFKRNKAELKAMHAISSDKIKETSQMLSDLGLL